MKKQPTLKKKTAAKKTAVKKLPRGRPEKEKTKVIRVPVSLVSDVEAMIEAHRKED